VFDDTISKFSYLSFFGKMVLFICISGL
jgi:hypothetical protein